MKKAAFLLAIFSLSVFTAQFALAGDYADYGDAPDPPYCSLFESDGARHINSEAIYEWLGENVDLEFNSHQVNNDLYDDGVVFNTPYWPGDTCSVDVTISVSQWDGGRYPPNLYLDAWFDWNRDNDWDDAGENAICGYSIDPSTWDGNTKTYNITFPVPSYATNLSFIWARFRLHYSSTLNQYCQQSPYGEVEDHRLEVPVHDVGVHAIVPGYEMVGHSDIAATVRNYGANDETGIDLYWMTDTGDSGATTIDTLLSQQEKDVNLGWTPDTTGLVSLTAWTDLAGDENAFNDTTSRSIFVYPVEVLVVDGDGSAFAGYANVLSYFTDALDSCGYTYAVVEKDTGGEDGPDHTVMQNYEAVVWFTGEVYNQPGWTLTANDEVELALYLDGGGNLFLSAQDYFWDRYYGYGSFSSGEFPYDYLGVDSTSQDACTIPDTGHGDGYASSVGEGLSYDLLDPFIFKGSSKRSGNTLYPDELVIRGNPAFKVTDPDTVNIAACQYEGTKGFKTVFTTLSFAGLVDGASTRAELMSAIMDWFGISQGIEGTVSEAKGPIEGAIVTATQGDTIGSDTTDASGYYIIENLPTGLYDVTARAAGYFSQSQANVSVLIHDTTTVNFSLTPLGGGQVLVVDADGSAYVASSDVRSYFTGALDSCGCTYDVVEKDVSGENGPNHTEMQNYEAVVWFTGETFFSAQTLTANDEVELALYLDGGGNLFLSAQDYLWDRYPGYGSFSSGEFPFDYLGVDSTSQDVCEIPDTGRADSYASSVAEGLSFDLLDPFILFLGSGKSKEPHNTMFIDDLVIRGDPGFKVTDPDTVTIAACQYEGTKGFKTVFTTVSFAGLVDGASTRADLMCAIMEWFGIGVNPPAAVTDLVATLVVNDIHLSWTAVTTDTVGKPLVVDLYHIYRDTMAYFEPGSEPFDSTAVTFYEDTSGVIGDVGVHHYYAVTAIAGGKESALSDQVGEFDRGLDSGTKAIADQKGRRVR